MDITGPRRSVNFSTINTIETLPNGAQAIYGDYTIGNAIFTALSGDIQTLEHDPICVSSNCYWPPFQTLGVSSQCEDISDLLELGCLSEDGQWAPGRNISMPGLGLIGNSTTNITSCGYFLNATSPSPKLMSGYMLNFTTNPPSPGTGLWMSSLALTIPTMNLTFWNGSYHFKEIADSWPIQDIMIVMNPDISSIYSHQLPMAAECVLRWAVQTISAESQNGIYSEKIHSVYTNDSTLPAQYKWHYNNYTNTGGAHTEYNIYIIPPDQNETFFIGMNVNSQTSVPFHTYIPSYLTVSNSTSATWWKFDNLIMSGAIDPELYPFNTEFWPKPNNVSEYVQRISSALTTAIRTYPNSSISVHGFGGLETYVHIEWGWFSLPVIVIFGTLLLLVKTITNGPSRGQGGVWKTSLLASLLHGMDETTRRDFGDAWDLSEMREKAQTSIVLFTPEPDGFRFHRHGLTLGQK
jgi:hypothetical protein